MKDATLLRLNALWGGLLTLVLASAWGVDGVLLAAGSASVGFGIGAGVPMARAHAALQRDGGG